MSKILNWIEVEVEKPPRDKWVIIYGHTKSLAGIDTGYKRMVGRIRSDDNQLVWELDCVDDCKGGCPNGRVKPIYWHLFPEPPVMENA